ncbi:MAG: hypothetical protein EOM18_16500 [Clostridia bacterium]|nr:hypothetical protein [Clostridia bacterium]
MPDMSTYLSSKTADYTTTELSVTPHNVMTEESVKNQIIYELDDASAFVVNLSDSYFLVTLEWTYLSDSSTDAETILDFWNHSTKGNGSERTFYWQHPIDGKTYTVRFMTPLRRVRSVDKPSGYAVSQITLRVEGKKP